MPGHVRNIQQRALERTGQLKSMSRALGIHKLVRFDNIMGAVNKQHVCVHNAFKYGEGEEGQGVSQQLAEVTSLASNKLIFAHKHGNCKRFVMAE